MKVTILKLLARTTTGLLLGLAYLCVRLQLLPAHQRWLKTAMCELEKDVILFQLLQT